VVLPEKIAAAPDFPVRQDCNCTINARIPDTVRHAGVLSLPFWAGIFYRKMAPGILQIAGK